MRVEEFLKDKNIEDLNVKQYISYVDKADLAAQIINDTCYDAAGNIKINSVRQLVIYNLVIINTYTDIDIDFSNIISEYDLLVQSGLIAEIFSLIPETELKQFELILKMTQDDLLFNTSTPHAYVSQQVERFSNLISATLNPVVEKFADEIGNLDENKINTIGKNLLKIVNKMK